MIQFGCFSQLIPHFGPPFEDCQQLLFFSLLLQHKPHQIFKSHFEQFVRYFYAYRAIHHLLIKKVD